MAVQMKAHTLKQRLCFTRPMRILLKFMRNMSCAVRDFQIFPSILPKVWLDAQQDFWDGFGELIQHDPHGVVYIPTATLMAELPGATAKENKIELAQVVQRLPRVPAPTQEDGHLGFAAHRA